MRYRSSQHSNASDLQINRITNGIAKGPVIKRIPKIATDPSPRVQEKSPEEPSSKQTQADSSPVFKDMPLFKKAASVNAKKNEQAAEGISQNQDCQINQSPVIVLGSLSSFNYALKAAAVNDQKKKTSY